MKQAASCCYIILKESFALDTPAHLSIPDTTMYKQMLNEATFWRRMGQNSPKMMWWGHKVIEKWLQVTAAKVGSVSYGIMGHTHTKKMYVTWMFLCVTFVPFHTVKYCMSCCYSCSFVLEVPSLEHWDSAGTTGFRISPLWESEKAFYLVSSSALLSTHTLSLLFPSLAWWAFPAVCIAPSEGGMETVAEFKREQ